VSDLRYFSYTYANDFFSATDRYYTQGIHPELVLKVFRKLPFMKLLPHLPHSTIRYGLSATQDCFTPASIRRDTILYGDRPYAGLIFLGHFKISNDEKKRQRLTAELDLGAMGPCAKCEEEQKGIHRMLVNIQPLGWEFQVSNDLMLNYRLRYEKGLLQVSYADLNGMAEVNAGTVYDNLGLGAQFRLGKKPGYFANERSPAFQCYLFGQGWIYGVGYNATLQGGPFSTSIYTLSAGEIAPVVLRGSLGAVLAYKSVLVEYRRTFITREIRTWWAHGWGHINIIVYF
jgi:lipid A 3-O-deacylase